MSGQARVKEYSADYYDKDNNSLLIIGYKSREDLSRKNAMEMVQYVIGDVKSVLVYEEEF